MTFSISLSVSQFFCLLALSPARGAPLPEESQRVLESQYQRVEREPIVRERVSKHVVEEVHPVIEREREQTHVIKTTVPIKGQQKEKSEKKEIIPACCFDS